MDDITSPDARTVRLKTVVPVPDLLERLALPAAALVRVVHGPNGPSLAGCGAFRLVGLDRGTFSMAPRLDDPAGRPFLDKLQVRTTGEPPKGKAAADRTLLISAGGDAWFLLFGPGAGHDGADRAAWRARAAAVLAPKDAVPGGYRRLERLADFAAEAGKSRPTSAAPPAPRALRLSLDGSDPTAAALARLLGGTGGAAPLVRPLPLGPAGLRDSLAAGRYEAALVRWDPAAGAADLALGELLAWREMAPVLQGGAAAGRNLNALEGLEKNDTLIPLVARARSIDFPKTLVGPRLLPLTGALDLAGAWIRPWSP